MEINNGKELLFYLIRKQKDCEFSLRTFLWKDNGLWKNCFSMLKLVKKGSRKQVKFDYGEYVFEEQIIDVSKGLDVISNLYSKNDSGKSKLIIPHYDSFEVENIPELTFVPSKYEYGLLKGTGYPIRFLNFRVKQDMGRFRWHHELIKKGLPYYPDLNEAISHLFELHSERFGSYGEVYVIIPDYRARIELLKIMFSKAEVTVDSPEVGFEDLLMTVFAKSGTKRITLPDIEIIDKSVEINVGFQPDTLKAVLFSHKDNLKIDEKEFTKWRTEREGVIIERPEEAIISLTRVGESQNLEYKLNIQTDNAKNEFIESVISFLNTNKGIILIGVDNKGNIVGTSKSVDDVQKMIHDSCDPPPTNIKIDEKEINGKKLLIVEVPEGDNKPYQSKRNKQWYIRHNANDMIMERSELLEILQKKSTTF